MAKILVIEDDQDVLTGMLSWMSMEKLQAESAERGADGLELLRFYQYDLVILDLGLPDMSGIEVLTQYRAQGGKAPVLILTGKHDVSDKERGLDAGADDYLTKPFHLKELGARIRALLRRPPVLTGETLRAKNLVLDLKARKLTVDGSEIALAPMEYSLLEFLMRYPNQVFTPEALLDRVWPSGSEASPATIRTCIKKIRQKVDPSPEQSIIKNLPGIGYRLDPD